jgi:hypothetical protein
MRESMKDLKIVDVPAEIRAGNLLNTSYDRYCSGNFLGMTVGMFTHICNACNL